MFRLVLAVVLLVGVKQATSSCLVNDKQEVLQGIYNNTLKCIRQTLYTQDDSWKEGQIPIEFNVDLDEFEIKDVSGTFFVEGSCDDSILFNNDAKYDGDFELFPPSYAMNLSLHNDKVACQGNYDINMTVLNYKVFGKGAFLTGIENVDLEIYLKFKLNNDYFEPDFDYSTNVQRILLGLTGLYDKDDINNEIMGNELQEQAASFMKNNPEIYTKVLVPVISKVFDDFDVFDLIEEVAEFFGDCIMNSIFPESSEEVSE